MRPTFTILIESDDDHLDSVVIDVEVADGPTAQGAKEGLTQEVLTLLRGLTWIKDVTLCR